MVRLGNLKDVFGVSMLGGDGGGGGGFVCRRVYYGLSGYYWGMRRDAEVDRKRSVCWC